MRHAVLGGGGVGGLIAAALTRAGGDVTLLLRPSSLAAYPGRLEVESVVLGSFAVDVAATDVLASDVDVMWVTTKATGLDEALAMAPPSVVGAAIVVPLLNGLDHVAALRRQYPTVCAAAMRVETERTGPGRIEQRSPFVRVEVAPPAGTHLTETQRHDAAQRVAAALSAAGIAATVRDDETTLLWDKLAFLAPVALATTAFDSALGDVRDRPEFLRCQDEVLTVARLDGALLNDQEVRDLTRTVPAAMRSSMQKDVDAGRAPEIDAIAGPILRRASRSAIPVPATRALIGLIDSRIAATSSGP